MKIAVTTTRESDDILNNKAESISKDLNIPYIRRGNLSINKTFLKGNIDYLLVIEKDKLVIKGKDDSTLFWHPNMTELKIKAIRSGNKGALIEASELKEGESVLDCTAGFAGESMIFSAVVGSGGRVIGTEINKYIAYITKYGLETYKDDEGNTPDYMKNINIINESYEDYLAKQEDNSFDVVYFDPMFKKPNKKSSGINAFRDFADHRGLTKETLKEALRVCRRKVVVKERHEENDFEKLGIEKLYGGSRKGAIVYGVIEKN